MWHYLGHYFIVTTENHIAYTVDYVFAYTRMLMSYIAEETFDQSFRLHVKTSALKLFGQETSAHATRLFHFWKEIIEAIAQN
jgi:hypothetical protein